MTIAGDVVTYTPNPATYYGADSFTFTATGPGGTLGAGDGEPDCGDARRADRRQQERGGYRL